MPLDSTRIDVKKTFQQSQAQTEENQASLHPRQFTLERVNSPEVLEKEWEPLLCQIFTDEGDREPIELLKERLENGENFFLMRDEQGKPIGIELAQTLLDEGAVNGRKAMYVPWTGIVEEHRNLGVGPHMHNAVADYMKKHYGVSHTIIDIEDPHRLHRSSYSAEELPEAIEYAHRRINFWRRQGYDVVDDNSRKVGDKLEYCRPGSEDEQTIQAYDHLTVRIHDAEIRARVFSPDGTQIRKSFVRECYMDMNRIQYGNMSENELRQGYPAIGKYLDDIDAQPGEFLAIRTEQVKAKTSPVVPHSITLASNAETPHQAMNWNHDGPG